jgi:hypothetical protein
LQVDKLSKGLAHEPSLRFLALRCDSRESRLFAKDVMGARAFPTIFTFNRDGALYRLKPKGYNEQGILAFINDTIRVEGEAPFELTATEKLVHSVFPKAQHGLPAILAYHCS